MRQLAAPALVWVALLALESAALVIRWLNGDPRVGDQVSFRLVLLVFATVGAVLAAARPRNPIGWLFLAVVLLDSLDRIASATAQFLPGLVSASTLTAVAIAIASQVGVLILGVIPLVLLTFPDGRLVSARWRLVAIGVPSFIAASALTLLLAAGPIHANVPNLAKPFGFEQLRPLVPAVQAADFAMCVVGVALGAASLFVRYRRARSAERQQVKWMAASASLLALALLTAFVLTGAKALFPGALDPALVDPIGNGVFVVGALSLPIAVAIGILRYRLFDIDVLINRTLVYGATSATIAATFYLGLVALQGIIRPVTSGSELAVAASTLISFALFQPIRRRVQSAVDRRFDRSRYDAAHTLDTFADDLRDEVDLDALRSDLLGAVSKTMSPAHASLWLRNSAE
jgi:hypothetical protein